MQPTGISPSLVRFLTTAAPDLMTELLTPGRVLEADVVSVFEGKAVLSFGRGVRLEATLQAPLQEGQRVRVQVQPQPQAQAQAQAQAQPQPQQAAPQPPTPQGAAQPGAPAAQPVPEPIVLKIIGQAPPRAEGATQATAAAQIMQEAPAPAINQPAAQQPGVPQVQWLPIPLPDGRQGWAQIHVQEDDSPRTRAQKGGPVQQVRIWWETPALGPVQVSMEAGATSLAALFTAAAAESKGVLEQSLPELQRSFARAGFPEARVGCRTAAPGEAVEPARTQGASRLDKRL